MDFNIHLTTTMIIKIILFTELILTYTVLTLSLNYNSITYNTESYSVSLIRSVIITC